MIKPFRAFSLEAALIVPYVALVLGLAIVIGFLSYTAASKAVLVVSEHLLLETAGRIGQAVERQLVGSGAVLETAFPSGIPAEQDIGSDMKALRTRFWMATSLHPDLNNYVYYGNRSGQGFGLYRHSHDEGELRLKLKADEFRSFYRFTGIDGPLRFASMEDKLFDPRQRPWYKVGETARTDIWTTVYIDFGTKELVATRARRITSTHGALEGVVATDVSLRDLNSFVRNLRVSPNGLAFIIDGQGELIASSVSPNIRTQPDGTNVRVAAAESGDARLTAIYAQVLASLAQQQKPSFPQTIISESKDGNTLHTAFDRIRDNEGLDWITVVAMPPGDFLAGVTHNVIRTLAIAFVAAILAVILGLRIIRWVTRDLNDLSRVARGVGEGVFSKPRAVDRSDEIGDLARNFEVMQHRLQTDMLTNLTNRTAFVRSVENAIDSFRQGTRNQQFGVLFIDLNGFKVINDRYGHDMGDRILVEVASRLAHQVRAGDVVARYGGDEFVLLIQNVANHQILASVREILESALNKPLGNRAADHDSRAVMQIGGAVGMALFPEDGDDAEALIKAADKDMYHRKAITKQAPPSEL